MKYLQRITDAIPDVAIDLKYAGTDNFAGKMFYPEKFEAMLVKDAVESLLTATKILKSINPEYQLIIWDAARPFSIQKALFEEVKGTEKEKYIAHPDIGSLHNYGCAIDIGLVDKKQQLLEMGTEYDYFGSLAEPSKEIEFLHSGALSQSAFSNRLLLRFIMSKAGFQPIPHEWWHFNFCSLDEAKRRFEMI